LIPGRGRIFSSRKHPEQLWGLSSFLFNKYLGAVSTEMKKVGQEVEPSPIFHSSYGFMMYKGMT